MWCRFDVFLRRFLAFRHRKVARDATAASIVLLKNDGGLLPLPKSAKVAAIGPYMYPELQPSMSGNTASNISGQVGTMNPYVHAYAGSSGVMVRQVSATFSLFWLF